MTRVASSHFGDRDRDISARAVEAFKPVAAASGDLDLFGLVDPYGYMFGDGFGSKGVSEKLKKLSGDLIVNVNSPGGDYFEGIALYNLFKAYDGKITMRVMGVAASAASCFLMAADEILVTKPSVIMIHNSSARVNSNKEELREVADILEGFDDAMAELYSDRSELTYDEAVEAMKKETYYSGKKAVEIGLADGYFDEDEIALADEKDDGEAPIARVDRVFARAGVTRSVRRELYASLKVALTPNAVEPESVTPSAGINAEKIAASIRELKDTLRE